MKYLGRDGTVFTRYLRSDGTVYMYILEKHIWAKKKNLNKYQAQFFFDLLRFRLRYLKTAKKAVLSQPRYHVKTVSSRPSYLTNISLDYPFKYIQSEPYLRSLGHLCVLFHVEGQEWKLTDWRTTGLRNRAKSCTLKNRFFCLILEKNDNNSLPNQTYEDLFDKEYLPHYSN